MSIMGKRKAFSTFDSEQNLVALEITDAVCVKYAPCAAVLTMAQLPIHDSRTCSQPRELKQPPRWDRNFTIYPQHNRNFVGIGLGHSEVEFKVLLAY